MTSLLSNANDANPLSGLKMGDLVLGGEICGPSLPKKLLPGLEERKTKKVKRIEGRLGNGSGY